jgi:hypothetical protein
VSVVDVTFVSIIFVFVTVQLVMLYPRPEIPPVNATSVVILLSVTLQFNIGVFPELPTIPPAK